MRIWNNQQWKTKKPSFIPFNLFGSISTINTFFFVFIVSCCCFSFLGGGGRGCGTFSLTIKMIKPHTAMTSFAHQKNLCKWGWGGSEIRLAIINCKRRTDFAPTERPRCCGWIFSNYFFGTFRRPNCMARVTQNLKADPSCHNTNVFQIGTRVNASFSRVIAFFKVKPSRGTNNSSLL